MKDNLLGEFVEKRLDELKSELARKKSSAASVHRLRQQARFIASFLDAYAGAFPERKKLKRQLKQIRTLTSAPRRMDIAIAYLADFSMRKELALSKLGQELRRERVRQSNLKLPRLKQTRIRKLIGASNDSFIALKVPLSELVLRVLCAEFTELEHASAEFLAAPARESAHELRLVLKRLMHALEPAVWCVETFPLEVLRAEIKLHLKDLGELQDTYENANTFRKLSRHLPKGRYQIGRKLLKASSLQEPLALSVLDGSPLSSPFLELCVEVLEVRQQRMDRIIRRMKSEKLLGLFREAILLFQQKKEASDALLGMSERTAAKGMQSLRALSEKSLSEKPMKPVSDREKHLQ